MSKNILGIFNESDINSINALIGELEKSSFDYLKLEGDGVKIVIGKNGVTDVAAVSAAPVEAPVAVNPPAVKPEPASEKAADTAAAAVVEEDAAGAKEAKVVEEKEGIFIIKAPSYGMFYAQPEPGAPPYVKIGDTVQKGDTVGLIEIMKTFTAIVSEVAGEIVDIHVKNEELLEPDQPLFSVKVQ